MEFIRSIFDLEEIKKFILSHSLTFLQAIVILIIGFIIIRWLKKSISRRLEKSKIEPSLRSFLTSLIGIVLNVALLIAFVNTIGIQMTSFIALIGSIGFAIGLALQGTLSNFAGGILILLVKPFKIGDFIEAQGFSGTVIDIHIFYTVLTTPDNKRIVIPNSGLSNSSVTNFSTYDKRRLELKVSCSYDNDTKVVKQILMDLIKNHSLILNDPEPVVYLAEYANSSINFLVRGWVQTKDFWVAYYDLMSSVKDVFDEHNITIPYPQIDVHLNNK